MVEFLKRLESLPREATFGKIKCIRELKKMLLNWQGDVAVYAVLDDSEVLAQVYKDYGDFEQNMIGEVRLECKKLCDSVVGNYSEKICYVVLIIFFKQVVPEFWILRSF